MSLLRLHGAPKWDATLNLFIRRFGTNWRVFGIGGALQRDERRRKRPNASAGVVFARAGVFLGHGTAFRHAPNFCAGVVRCLLAAWKRTWKIGLFGWKFEYPQFGGCSKYAASLRSVIQVCFVKKTATLVIVMEPFWFGTLGYTYEYVRSQK